MYNIYCLLRRSTHAKSLARALFKVFQPVVYITGVLQVFQQVVNLSIPLIVQQVLLWLADKDRGLGIGVTLALCL